MTWTHRERLLAALNHEEPDRVPIDLGGAEFTSVTFGAYEKLKKYLGVNVATEPMSIIHSVAHPAEVILERFGVDTRNVQPGVQQRMLGGRPVYVMPHTSGLNAHSRLVDLTAHLAAAATLADKS
jgi:uroporphyrinogen decarboxylase|tara:strand:- start:247 stop:621 length:375 start_codon:yes stop_codon:yes gene_type:complete